MEKFKNLVIEIIDNESKQITLKEYLQLAKIAFPCNDKKNRILMTCLFKCINLNLLDSNIIDLSIKILFRYISYIKINKEKNRINSLENNLEDD